jgi:ATP-dependent 26S proteasome regulatory subunit
MPLPQLSRGCLQLRAVRIAAPGRFERVLEFALPADAGKAQVVCDCHMRIRLQKAAMLAQNQA